MAELDVEGKIAGLRTICATIIEEIDPNGDLKDRVRTRLTSLKRELTTLSQSAPGPQIEIIRHQLGVLDSFIAMLGTTD